MSVQCEYHEIGGLTILMLWSIYLMSERPHDRCPTRWRQCRRKPDRDAKPDRPESAIGDIVVGRYELGSAK